MLNEFGKLVRKHRIDLQIKLGDMAEGISVSSAYLSAVENNKKKLTPDLVEKVIKFLEVDNLSATEIRDNAARSRSEHTINVGKQNIIATEAVAMFARNIESSSLSEEQAKKILAILNKGTRS